MSRLDKSPTTEDLAEEEFRDPRAGKRTQLPEKLTQLRQKLGHKAKQGRPNAPYNAHQVRNRILDRSAERRWLPRPQCPSASDSPFLSAASWTPISNRQPRPQHGPQFAGVGNSNGLVDRIFDIRGLGLPRFRGHLRYAASAFSS